MSRSSRTSRTGSLLEGGTVLAQMLIKQPVKEAVREALAEDKAESMNSKGGARRSVDTGDSGAAEDGGSNAVRRLLLLAAFAGVAYFAMQRRGGDIQEELTQEVGIGQTGEESGSSVSDSLSSDEDTSEEATTGGETDEGPTTRS